VGFVMNPTLMKAKQTIEQKTEIPKHLINSNNFNPATYMASIMHRNPNKENEKQTAETLQNSHEISKDSYQLQKVYSIRRHYEEEEQRRIRKEKKRQQKSDKQNKISVINEVVDEERLESNRPVS
jgi:hypothetical protein